MRAADLLPLAPLALEARLPTSQGLPPSYTQEEWSLLDHMLQARDRPTALFCVTDFIAGAVMEHVLRRGLQVPEDIALVGFDDIPMAPFLPVPLTTVSLPGQEIGRCAAELLINQILGSRDEQARMILPTQLVVRNSSGLALAGRPV